MSLKFGLLGIGQFGSNIADYAVTKGFKVIVANTALVDLKKNEYIKEENKIHLGGDGAGRDRTIGMQATINNAEEILKRCKEEFSGCDVVFVAASGGGGTGSGGLPIGIEILMEEFENLCAIIALPENSESPRAKMNTLECFQQLSSFQNLGCVFIIDNQKAKDLNQNLPRNKIYEITNREMIDYIYEINNITDKPSYVSNFDASDLLGVFQERGYAMISKSEGNVSLSDNKFKVAKIIRESWKMNYQPMFPNGQIVKAAIISEIDPTLSNNIDVNVIFQEVGIPYDFNDICFYPSKSENDTSQKNYTFYSILSGLAFPIDRLTEITTSVKDVEEKLISNLNTSQTQTFNGGDWTSKFKKEKKPEKEKKGNLLEKMKKYMLK